MSCWVLVLTCESLCFDHANILTHSRCRFNQWSGINSLAYFLPITFERNIGLSTELSLIIAGVLGIQYFFVSWL